MSDPTSTPDQPSTSPRCGLDRHLWACWAHLPNAAIPLQSRVSSHRSSQCDAPKNSRQARSPTCTRLANLHGQAQTEGRRAEGRCLATVLGIASRISGWEPTDAGSSVNGL
jgi:hypothetical protein